MTPYHIIIPARYASTRLPGKPLLDLAGKTLLERVYRQAEQSAAQSIVIATDDQRIVECAESFNASVVMTSPDHESGTDRLQEVAQQLGYSDDTIVVNVQGDEPMIPPTIIDQVAQNLADCDAAMATLCKTLHDPKQLFDPNAVKVVMNKNGMAQYFSRAPIPWHRDSFDNEVQSLEGLGSWHLHIGIYAYRVGFLHQFVAAGPCELEQCERLEQLRALWQGYSIHVATALQAPPPGIDTPEDLDAVRKLLAGES